MALSRRPCECSDKHMLARCSWPQHQRRQPLARIVKRRFVETKTVRERQKFLRTPSAKKWPLRQIASSKSLVAFALKHGPAKIQHNENAKLIEYSIRAPREPRGAVSRHMDATKAKQYHGEHKGSSSCGTLITTQKGEIQSS